MPTTKTNVPKNEESELYTPITPAETNSIRSIKNPIGVQLLKSTNWVTRIFRQNLMTYLRPDRQKGAQKNYSHVFSAAPNFFKRIFLKLASKYGLNLGI